MDIEDAVKKQCLSWDKVQKFLDKRCVDSQLFAQAMKRTIMQVSSDCKSDSEFAQAFRVNAISELVLAAVRSFRDRYDEIMEGCYTGELICDYGYEGASLVESCKNLLRETVFRRDEVLRLEVRGRQVLHDLMGLFWEGVSEFIRTGTTKTSTYAGKLYLLIAGSYRALFEKRFAAAPGEGTYFGHTASDGLCLRHDRRLCVPAP